MSKVRTKKKIWKRILIASAAAVLAVGISAISFFLIVTADARLDMSKLTGSPSPLVLMSNTNTEIVSSDTSQISGDIPEHTKNAFIAIEDKRFLSHRGIDLRRIGGALFANIRSGSKSQGASTITQQLVKNTHLSAEKTISRKLKEIKIAFEVEKQMTKDEILKAYLDNIYFGNGCIGIESAAKFYFGKTTSQLNLAESALLAGLVKAPSATEPKNHLEKALERRNLVLEQMKAQDLISLQEAKEASSFVHNFVFEGNDKLFENYSRAAKTEAAKILGIDLDTLEESAYVVETYADENIQKTLQDACLYGRFRPSNGNEKIGSLGSVVVDSKTGGVKAFFSVGEFDFLNQKRQPASTIKPLLVFAPALEERKTTPESFVFDKQTNFSGYEPKNAGNQYSGWISARNALAKSKNVPAVKLLDMVGIEKAKQYVEKLGIDFEPEDNNLALALGGMTKGTTILELAGAYTVFPDGNVETPAFVKRIRNKNGKILFEHKPQSKKVFSESTAFLVTDMLAGATKTGTAKKLGDIAFDVASKTGTIGDENFNTDCYNVAFTSQDVVVTLLTKGNAEVGFGTNVNGATLPTAFVKYVLSNIYSSKPKDFKKPTTVATFDLDSRALENHQLLLASPSTPERYRVAALFDVSNRPLEYYVEKVEAPEIVQNVNNEENKNFVVFIEKPTETKNNSSTKSKLDGVLKQIFDW